MKVLNRFFSLVIVLLVFSGCSKSDNSQPPPEPFKTKGLRIGMQYMNSQDVYIFRNEGVSVDALIIDGGDIYRDTRDGSLLVAGALISYGLIMQPLSGGYPKGSRVQQFYEVIFGPHDRMPVLENTTYRVEGASVYVDWSQHHSKYFGTSGCGSASEVFNIKNDGLILESATSPGFILTLDLAHPLPTAESVINDAANQLRSQNVH